MHCSHSQWTTHYAQVSEMVNQLQQCVLGFITIQLFLAFKIHAYRTWNKVFPFKENNFNVIVRNSGGLAVVLDEGVLNVSLLFQETEKGIDIDLGYDTMWHLIQEMLKDYDVTIEAKEIVGSYCPGSYDLSIRDQKFAGISQRRIRGGVAVQIYLCATGSGSERAALVRDFTT